MEVRNTKNAPQLRTYFFESWLKMLWSGNNKPNIQTNIYKTSKMKRKLWFNLTFEWSSKSTRWRRRLELQIVSKKLVIFISVCSRFLPSRGHDSLESVYLFTQRWMFWKLLNKLTQSRRVTFKSSEWVFPYLSFIILLLFCGFTTKLLLYRVFIHISLYASKGWIYQKLLLT